MANGFFNKVNLSGHISNMGSFGSNMMPSVNLDKIDSTSQTKSFTGVMTDLANGLNKEINAPDQLLKDAMTGNGDVDIHDVMTAMAKAELSVSIATQLTGKVIQAYDKIMQISV